CMQGETDFKEVQVLPDKTVQFYYSLLDSRDSELPLLDHELIDKKLEKLVLSPTSLNQFLACPRSFYFESILGVPLSNNQYLGFGNAVHDALHLFLNKLKNGLEANPETIKELFEISIQKFRSFFTPKQFENYLAHGLDILPRYVEDKLPLWREADMLLAEKGIDHVIHKDVPITGRLDLMLRGKDGRLRVIDFKTGNVDNTVQLNKKLKPAKDYSDIGGDYWRQVVFYQILLAERKDANGHMDEGIMSFVEYDKYGQFVDRQFLVNYGEVEIVSDQLVDSYQKMKNHEFDVDCNRPECTWCSFIKNDYVLPAESIRESEEENEDRYLSFGEDTIQLHFDF
ncbi:MAG: PD-(D/E)XK nuclease family protein, partial [Saprospiraceae bacterium]|nr:PD-(D/E)XK nuclease family protein [Saprospiraceae bacterium]